jgi:hypothetical protein
VDISEEFLKRTIKGQFHPLSCSNQFSCLLRKYSHSHKDINHRSLPVICILLPASPLYVKGRTQRILCKNKTSDSANIFYYISASCCIVVSYLYHKYTVYNAKIKNTQNIFNTQEVLDKYFKNDINEIQVVYRQV